MMKSMIPLAILLAASAVFAQQDVVKHAAELAENSKKIMEIERESFARKFITLGKIALPDSADYDQLYYDLNFTITTSPDNLAGAVHGVFKSNINGLNEIKLNFDSREGLTPWADFSVTGNVTSYTHSDWVLRVTLDQTYNVGDTFAIDVTYSGVPREGGFKAFSFDLNNYNEPIISTLSEPYFAQTWWPCKDDPGDKLDSVRITVTVPDQFIVASNGLLESEVTNPNSTRTFIWNERYPITTYLVSLAISNYTVFADSFEYVPGKFMPIEYFVYPQNYNTAQTAFQLLPDMLAVYSKLYGLYPFINEKYGQAEFDWGGAMEHQTCTSIGRVSTSWETAYAHELSHQWFGDLVTCHDWGNIWLNEGWSFFMAMLHFKAM
jgi:aminopeptidase N